MAGLSKRLPCSRVLHHSYTNFPYHHYRYCSEDPPTHPPKCPNRPKYLRHLKLFPTTTLVALIQTPQRRLPLRRDPRRQQNLLARTTSMATMHYRIPITHPAITRPILPTKRVQFHLTCTVGYTDRMISQASTSPVKPPSRASASRPQYPITSVGMRGT